MQELIDKIKVKCVKVPLKESLSLTALYNFYTILILKIVTNSSIKGF